MKINGSDPDLETLVGRIQRNEIDLQPDFQRGEIWSDYKRRRLIDSILRGWHIPPVHFVIDSDRGMESVLDGQQRLAAIRDFFNDRFAIDGFIEPEDSKVQGLHGIHYSELPSEWLRRVNRYTLRVLSLSDFLPQEPGELFFRLNQPVSLTAAEQRNAFFGGAREQVRHLVGLVVEGKVDQEYWAFTNVRMSYDDVLARTAYLLDQGNLTRRVTSADLANLYRQPKGFSVETIDRLEVSILNFAKTVDLGKSLRLNKATAQSWLLFASVAQSALVGGLRPEILEAFISAFSFAEFQAANDNRGVEPEAWPYIYGDSKNSTYQNALSWEFSASKPVMDALGDYRDRASSRVADVSSVLIRDFVIWYLFFHFFGNQIDGVKNSHPAIAALLAESKAKRRMDYRLLVADTSVLQGWGGGGCEECCSSGRLAKASGAQQTGSRRTDDYLTDIYFFSRP